MSKKIVVVNADSRMGWNTETLLSEASKGAESAGAEIVRRPNALDMGRRMVRKFRVEVEG